MDERRLVGVEERGFVADRSRIVGISGILDGGQVSGWNKGGFIRSLDLLLAFYTRGIIDVLSLDFKER